MTIVPLEPLRYKGFWGCGELERDALRLKWHKKFHSNIMGKAEEEYGARDVDIRNYAKYVLREGSIFEKRELLGAVKNKLVFINRAVKLENLG